MICPSYTAPLYFFFSSQVPPLFYYSHIPSIFVATALGVFVLLSNKTNLLNKIFFCITASFALWVLTDMVLWTNNSSDVIIYMWSFTDIISTAIFTFCLYFIYVFCTKKDASFKAKLIVAVSLLPVFILAPTHYYLQTVDLDLCGITVEGSFYNAYYSIYCVILSLLICYTGFKYYRKAEKSKKQEIGLMIAGIMLFLLMFFISSFVASYLVDQGIVDNYQLEWYGLLGMLFFCGFISYLIVKFHTFNIKIIATQALVIIIWIILFSKIFVSNSTPERVVDIFTLIITIPFGILLVRSVIKEVRLAEQQYEMVATVSHQLRTPLTPVLGYAAMMDQGDFDGHPEELKDAQHRLLISTQRLRNIINDFLQMFELEGEHKMDSVKTPLQDIVNEAMAGVKENYEQKKLYLKLENPSNVNPILVGETKLLVQAINNLLDNAQRYTIEGGSTVQLSVEKNRAIIKVTDTGIGLDENDKQRLFTKFYRSDAAKEVRPDGSGLGLPIVKTVIEAHGGKVHAESEGRGKGTTFIIELPLKKQ